MQRELLVGERKGDRRRFEIREEELEERQVPQLRGVLRRATEPDPQGVLTGRGDREQPASPADQLTLLGQEAQRGQTGRLLVQESVRERPDVADRRGDVALELVRRRGPFALEEAEDEVRGWGERDLGSDRELD